MNWLWIISIAAAFCLGIVVGIWIDDDLENPAEW